LSFDGNTLSRLGEENFKAMNNLLRLAYSYRSRARQLRSFAAMESSSRTAELLLTIADGYEEKAAAAEAIEQTHHAFQSDEPDIPQTAMTDSGVAEKRPERVATLGEVLFAKSKPTVSEQEWVTLVRSIAAREHLALHALYEMAHRVVFTLIMRIAANRETAEELTVEVFHAVWRGASRYDAAKGTVLSWIMNQAHSRAINRLRFEGRKKRSYDSAAQPQGEVAADTRDVPELREQVEELRAALTELTPDERQAIESTFFGGRTHVEATARLNQPRAVIKTRIRSGLHKLRHALAAETLDRFDNDRCEQSEATCAHAIQALAVDEAAAARKHIASCPDCQDELESLRPVVNRFAAWPTDVLRPAKSLRPRLALCISEETGEPPVLPQLRPWSEPEWEQVAPGTECKLLATDTEGHQVSMLVRLAPGASSRAHTHAGPEECHLLDGVLMIDEQKLFPGDYKYAAPGTRDELAWSKTGCTCFLVTSTQNVLL
jgi:RNA polymerase sigma-70 factor (ECF subfamily)